MQKPDPNEPATKADLANLVTKDELKSEMKTLNSELRGEMKGLKSEIKIDLADAKSDIAFRMYGALLGQMALTLAAVYFIVHNLR